MNVVRLDTRIEMWVSHEAVTDVFYSIRKNLAFFSLSPNQSCTCFQVFVRQCCFPQLCIGHYITTGCSGEKTFSSISDDFLLTQLSHIPTQCNW